MDPNDQYPHIIHSEIAYLIDYVHRLERRIRVLEDLLVASTPRKPRYYCSN